MQCNESLQYFLQLSKKYLSGKVKIYGNANKICKQNTLLFAKKFANSKVSKMAMPIYHSSPKAYKLLSGICLLSICILQRMLKCIARETGVSKTILNMLKIKVDSINENEKLCVQCFDKMSLKQDLIYEKHSDKVYGFEDYGESLDRTPKVANYALVFML